MDDEDGLKAKASDLCDEARALEISKALEEEQGAIWNRELAKRRNNPREDYDDISEAKVNRDWHMQKADIIHRKIKKLVRQAKRLLKKVDRIKKRRK